MKSGSSKAPSLGTSPEPSRSRCSISCSERVSKYFLQRAKRRISAKISSVTPDSVSAPCASGLTCVRTFRGRLSLLGPRPAPAAALRSGAPTSSSPPSALRTGFAHLSCPQPSHAAEGAAHGTSIGPGKSSRRSGQHP